MEPDRQVEIQLGHLCTNRCVFCVSGQRNELGTAGPLEAAALLTSIEQAREAGHERITLLGGEPTIQPGFMDAVRRCVGLGYEEIVIFTNGVKTARPSFVDEVLATGGSFTWRLSIQGADKISHEQTTRRPGSFGRILASLENLAARNQTITVNTCMVRSNYRSVDRFPDLLLPFDVKQLHLDMVRPRDAGERKPKELEEIIPRYAKMVPALERMISGFESKAPGFDVNIGNYPPCLAPELARWIRHDGETTETVAIDGTDRLSKPWNKYEVKARDKIKPSRCRECVLADRCSGVYETYARIHGIEDLSPISRARLAAVDPSRMLLPQHVAHLKPAVMHTKWPAPLSEASWSTTGDNEVTITLHGPEAIVVSLRPPSHIGCAACDLFSLHIRKAPASHKLAMSALELLWRVLAKDSVPWHPLGTDAVVTPPGSMGRQLARLRRAAPFPPLVWSATEVRPGKAEIHLDGPSGEQVVFWLEPRGRRTGGGYRIEKGPASPEVREGMRALMNALSSR